MTHVVLGSGAPDSGYKILKSLRFKSFSSAYISRTPASSGNRKAWTLSFWVKKTGIATQSVIIHAGTNGVNDSGIYFRANDDKIDFFERASNVIIGYITTVAAFRDPSAWQHFVFVYDSANATASNRMRIYANGIRQQVTTSNTLPQNTDSAWNAGSNAHRMGANLNNTGYANYYMAELNFIDGFALEPGSFAEADAGTGIWSPKKYTGTYGTNGYYLNFNDNSGSTATTLGKDSSGNGNNWTPNGLSVLAGIQNDVFIDVPTGSSDGANNRGNYCTFNSIDPVQGFAGTSTSQGNLRAQYTSGLNNSFAGTIFVSSGKWYFEMSAGTNINANSWVGVQPGPYKTLNVRAYRADGQYFDGSAWSAYGSSYTVSGTIGVALDLDNQTITFYKNNVSQGQKTAIGITAPVTVGFNSQGLNEVMWLNCGQRPFEYTPPSGFKAINTFNLP